MQLADFINPDKFPNKVRPAPEKLLPLPRFDKMKKGFWSQTIRTDVTVELYTHMLFRGDVIGYDKNRGGQDINLAKIKKWYGKFGEGLKMEVLGEIKLSDFRQTENCFVLPSHHHRSALLLYIYWHSPQELWDLIKQEEFSIRISVPEKHVATYCAENDLTRAAAKGFLRNPDMVVGHILSCDTDENGKYQGRISTMLSLPARKLLATQSGLLQPLASMLYAHHYKTFTSRGEVINLLESHATIYNCRQKAKTMTELPYVGNEDLLAVEDEFLARVAAAVEDYLEFRTEFELEIRKADLGNYNTSAHKDILKNTAFFTFYVQDRLFFKQLPSAKLVADRLFHHATGPELGDLVKYLWNGGQPAMERRTNKITDYLNKGKKKTKMLNGVLQPTA